MSGEDLNSQVETSAYGSYEARQFLMRRAVQGILHYPVLGIGVRNFQTYSTIWRDVHMTYLQVAVEGGIAALVLYLMFFWRGFSNLRKLRRRRDLDTETKVFVGALHSSLVGFVVGACFAPEAYQFFPYFTVAYTSALAATLQKLFDGEEPAKGNFEVVRLNLEFPVSNERVLRSWWLNSMMYFSHPFTRDDEMPASNISHAGVLNMASGVAPPVRCGRLARMPCTSFA